jgi:hypothetical protein
MDGLLQHLVGRRQMTGTVRGRPVMYRRAARSLRGAPHGGCDAGPSAYEARVFLGVESAAHRYIAHWLDNFGAGYSIPHAVAEARSDTSRFSLAYADGPFRDIFVYDRRRDTWYFRLESGDSVGRWDLFAEYQVRRR